MSEAKCGSAVPGSRCARSGLQSLTIVAAAPLLAWADGKPSLRSVRVELPADNRMFPDGPGSDAINNNCLACHSAGMVLNQPAMTKAQWEAEVRKMITTYRAPVDPKDVDAIVEYLAVMR